MQGESHVLYCCLSPFILVLGVGPEASLKARGVLFHRIILNLFIEVWGCA